MRASTALLLLALLLTLSGCELIAGVFQAGMLVGVVAVILVVLFLVWLVSRIGGREG